GRAWRPPRGAGGGARGSAWSRRSARGAMDRRRPPRPVAMRSSRRAAREPRTRARSQIVVEERFAVAHVAHDQLTLLRRDVLHLRAEPRRGIGVVAALARPADDARAVELIAAGEVHAERDA